LEYNRNLFDEYYNILESYVYATKYHYNRPRPEQIAPYYNEEVKVIYTSTHQTPAYPSGHTAYAALAAHMLSKKFPDYKKEFFDLAEQAGTARILQGVHYPSDNTAGLKLARVIFEEIERKVTDVSKRTKTYPIDYKS
jgi:membrane-associated phospholipid phosphatase